MLTKKILLALPAVVLPLAAQAQTCTSLPTGNLLANPGFESGLSGWTETQGAGMACAVTVAGAGAVPPQAIEPNTPRSGQFLLSTSILDCATPGTPVISLRQVVDLSAFCQQEVDGSQLVARGFFSGAQGVGGTSDDTGELVVEFFSGGAAGTSLGVVSSGQLDPIPGYWNELKAPEAIVPAGTDTLVFDLVTRLDPGAASIDLGIDDLHLSLTVPPVSYCTAGVSASGCQAVLSACGAASATAPSGFTLQASSVEGLRDGLFFFGTSGRLAKPWGSGTSFRCVAPPVKRAGVLTGTGTLGACDGSFAQDLNALWCPTCPRPNVNPGPAAVVQVQLWYRDPANTSNRPTSLSDALEFVVGP